MSLKYEGIEVRGNNLQTWKLVREGPGKFACC